MPKRASSIAEKYRQTTHAVVILRQRSRSRSGRLPTKDPCNPRGTGAAHRSIDPSARKQRGPQDDRVGVTHPRRKMLWRVAQAFDLAGVTNTVGAPSFAQFAKGGSWKPLRDVARLRSRCSKRNLPPALIHSHRSSLVEQIETITAPAPSRRFHQPPLHRIASNDGTSGIVPALAQNARTGHPAPGVP
jgi:hypothetical protein